MSRANLDFTTVQRRRMLHWQHVKKAIAEWRRRARSRNELMNLSDRQLRDIGMSQGDASCESAKPFWMA